eukprot:TRINITY_DN591_c0_g1_i1.p1 TRINITY_DN591_c0_g1~~TRINITY_DN591_c0_g1_i1.p1  ORF type:complete len:360 (-),score=43.12 TRINITY_DN591_c0_g1_i1:85-1164(-)
MHHPQLVQLPQVSPRAYQRLSKRDQLDRYRDMSNSLGGPVVTLLPSIQMPQMLEENDYDSFPPGIRANGEIEDLESTRGFLFSIAPKMGKTLMEVIPYINKFEKEWVLRKDQLKMLSENDFIKLNLPMGLIGTMRDELGLRDPGVPGMLEYKLRKHEKDHQKSGTGPGRKRKRLTVADWRKKVQDFAKKTDHDPTPFRITSIFQVECYCCGYAVNMNKPGQLYYLKRHVEGVRPDLRKSNHYKNYDRWCKHQGNDSSLDSEPPLKKQKSSHKSPSSPLSPDEVYSPRELEGHDQELNQFNIQQNILAHAPSSFAHQFLQTSYVSPGVSLHNPNACLDPSVSMHPPLMPRQQLDRPNGNK